MSTFGEELNNYYKLKTKYETSIQKEKVKIRNNNQLSLKEKKMEFQQFKPKCINCNRPVGTLFYCKYNEEDGFRILNGKCGDLVNPCNLDIKLNLGVFESLPEIIKEYENENNDYKNKIIIDKNKLLFGYITTEKALENFDLFKEKITEINTLLAFYLESYLNVTDNKEKIDKYKKIQVEAYIIIQNIKDLIIQFNKTNDLPFVKDAVEIYINQLMPKLNEVMNLKYTNNRVEFYESDNSYHLIQEKISNFDKEYIIFEPSIISLDIGVKSNNTRKNRKTSNINTATVTRKNKKPLLIVESSSNSNSSSSDKDVIPPPLSTKEVEPSLKPTYDSDGNISWPNSMYETIWNSLNFKYKNALKTDKEWLEATMNAFVDDKKNRKSREFVNAPNLIIPPNIIDNNQYDFGVDVYNKIFNNLPEFQKTTILSFKSKNDNNQNKLLLNALGLVVGKEVGFSRY
jgi:hypothetical protein